MYAQVVVLTYQPPDINSYTYEVPKNLEKEIKPGQLVEVPFGKRNPTGIVLNTTSEIRNSKFEIRNLKEISNITLDQSLLLPYQIKLLTWMAFYYHAPMVNCLEAMLPKIPSRWFRVHSSQNNKERTVNQTLVLVPTINRIPETLAQFKEAKNYLLYHNELKIQEKFATWLKILSGQFYFIFGSRSAIFTPCPNLKKIIIFDEHDDVYKDERSPYFDTLTVAEKLQELTGAEIQIIDHAPKIATYFSHKNQVKIPQHQVKTSIVSMASERKKGNKSSVSDLLAALLVRTYEQKGSTLLFLNKKAGSGYVYCKSCQHQQFLDNQPEVCPNCQSRDFYFNSTNITSLAATVRKILPQVQVNLIAEGANYQSPVASSQQPTIDIATAAVFYRLTLKKYDLTAHIALDTTLNLPEFTAEEKIFIQIANLKKLTKENGRVILQTFNPDHQTVKDAASGNYLPYFNQSLAQRKTLSYPPFGLLIKLTIKGKNPMTLEEKAEKLIEELNQSPVTILGPYRSVFSQKKPSYNIILKTKLGSYNLKEREKAITIQKSHLVKASRDWQIIVEPTSIN